MLSKHEKVSSLPHDLRPLDCLNSHTPIAIKLDDMHGIEKLLGPKYQITRQYWARLMAPLRTVHHICVYLPREAWPAIFFRPVRVRLFQGPGAQEGAVMWDVIQKV